MNIGLLTLPLHVNYGGILQAYALKTILERFGFRVFLITHKESPTFKSLLKEVGVRIYNLVGLLSHRYTQRIILRKENEDFNIFCNKPQIFYLCTRKQVQTNWLTGVKVN